MRVMAADERRAFLLEGTRTGKFAVTRADGTPFVVPAWFLLDGDDVIFTTQARSIRGRALRRDGRVSMCVDDERPLYSFVRINGRAQVSEDLTELRRWARAIGARYMGEDVADSFADRNAVPGELLVRLVPDEIVAQAEIAG